MTNDCNLAVVFLPELLSVCLSSRMVSCSSDWTMSRETSLSLTEKSKEPPQHAVHILCYITVHLLLSGMTSTNFTIMFEIIKTNVALYMY